MSHVECALEHIESTLRHPPLVFSLESLAFEALSSRSAHSARHGSDTVAGADDSCGRTLRLQRQVVVRGVAIRHLLAPSSFDVELRVFERSIATAAAVTSSSTSISASQTDASRPALGERVPVSARTSQNGALAPALSRAHFELRVSLFCSEFGALTLTRAMLGAQRRAFLELDALERLVCHCWPRRPPLLLPQSGLADESPAVKTERACLRWQYAVHCVRAHFPTRSPLSNTKSASDTASHATPSSFAPSGAQLDASTAQFSIPKPTASQLLEDEVKDVDEKIAVEELRAALRCNPLRVKHSVERARRFNEYVRSLVDAVSLEVARLATFGAVEEREESPDSAALRSFFEGALSTRDLLCVHEGVFRCAAREIRDDTADQSLALVLPEPPAFEFASDFDSDFDSSDSALYYPFEFTSEAQNASDSCCSSLSQSAAQQLDFSSFTHSPAKSIPERVAEREQPNSSDRPIPLPESQIPSRSPKPPKRSKLALELSVEEVRVALHRRSRTPLAELCAEALALQISTLIGARSVPVHVKGHLRSAVLRDTGPYGLVYCERLALFAPQRPLARRPDGSFAVGPRRAAATATAQVRKRRQNAAAAHTNVDAEEQRPTARALEFDVRVLPKSQQKRSAEEDQIKITLGEHYTT